MKHLLIILALITTAVTNAAPVHKIGMYDVVEQPHPKKLPGQNGDDVKCLAYSIYREAGNLDSNGQYAVGQVHINRVREGSWGKHLCQVVFAHAQFSWTLEKRKVRWTERDEMYYTSIAEDLVRGEVKVNYITSTKVLHYYANYVHPKWARQGTVVATAGPHIFVRDVPH